MRAWNKDQTWRTKSQLHSPRKEPKREVLTRKGHQGVQDGDRLDGGGPELAAGDELALEGL